MTSRGIAAIPSQIRNATDGCPSRGELAVAGSLVAGSLAARPLRLQMDWEDMRAVIAHADISSRVVVWTGEDGKGRVRGRLVGVTDTVITLGKPDRDATVPVPRDEIRRVRLMPRKGAKFRGHPYGKRIGAVAVVVPLGIVLHYLGAAIPGGLPEGPIFQAKNLPKGLGLAMAVNYALYRLAWWADRRNGAILIEVNRGKDGKEQ